jgi:hypothetical protein
MSMEDIILDQVGSTKKAEQRGREEYVFLLFLSNQLSYYSTTYHNGT